MAVVSALMSIGVSRAETGMVNVELPPLFSLLYVTQPTFIHV